MGSSLGSLAVPQLVVGNTHIDLVGRDCALSVIAGAMSAATPLAVVSVNLNHLHVFANEDPSSSRPYPVHRDSDRSMRWLTLLDGVPLVRRASTLTGKQWPKLSGSDLLEEVLQTVSKTAGTVGFLGGSEEMHSDLREVIARRFPRVIISGTWAPKAAELANSTISESIADEIRDARTDVLVFALGKPTQEEWMARYGARTGARVLLGFGAASDFLAGHARRAPKSISGVGGEWAWRLMREPRRLWRRYLLEGPPTLWRLARNASIVYPRFEADGDSYSNRAVKGAVIVPAFNESTVIHRTLLPLSKAAVDQRFDLIVVCNGCTDNTASVARAIPGVRVIELEQASKALALNVGDMATTLWPRLYLDADIQISAQAVLQTLDRLAVDEICAARPDSVHDMNGSTDLVRRYYRTRHRILGNEPVMWGAGVYGLNEKAHARFGTFPIVISDDLFVDASFDDREKSVVSTEPAIVMAPKDAKSLIAILRRCQRGQLELNGDPPTVGTLRPSRRTALSALKTVRGPQSALDVMVYLGVAVVRRLNLRDSRAWERDESSRT